MSSEEIRDMHIAQLDMIVEGMNERQLEQLVAIARVSAACEPDHNLLYETAIRL